MIGSVEDRLDALSSVIADAVLPRQQSARVQRPEIQAITAEALTARLEACTAAFWRGERHPRGKTGKFIKVNAIVNVDPARGRGQKKRGKVISISKKGSRVLYEDGSSEVLDAQAASKRIDEAPKSWARIGDTRARNIRAPHHADPWSDRTSRVSTAPGGTPAPPSPGTGTPATGAPGGAPAGTKRAAVLAHFGMQLGTFDAASGSDTVVGADGSEIAKIKGEAPSASGRRKFTVTLPDGTALGPYANYTKALEELGKHRTANP